MIRRAPIVLALASLASLACAGVELEGVVLESARYLLAWDATGTTLADGARVLRNDLGHEIRVTRASLASHESSMVACSDIAPAVTLRDLVGPAIARAGHGGTEDPSTTTEPAIEDLVLAPTLELGAPTFPRDGYCRLHYVVGVIGAGHSLEIEGTSDGVPFALETAIATGTLIEMDEIPTTGDGAHAEITIVRSLATAFDGFDPATSDPETGARAVLANVIAATRVSITRD